MYPYFAAVFAVVFCAAGATAGEIQFTKQTLCEDFFSEGCAVGDFNRDGKPDVLAGPFWYESPDWTPHEIRKPGEFQAKGGYSLSFGCGVEDVNNDGWDDAIVIGFPGKEGWWYENPKGGDGHWTERVFSECVCNESPLAIDYDLDGRRDLVFPSENDGSWAWYKAPSEVGGTEWARNIISASPSPGTHRFAHGVGVGDLNVDGRNDVIITEGWWEGPEDPTKPDWVFHTAKLGPHCAHMHVYDFDRDGDMDVVSSSAHDYGIWWFEQGKDSSGATTWTQHEIAKAISQTHALELVDMNADGAPDLVTGKRYYAHNGHDPGAEEPAVVCWYEYKFEDGKPSWTYHQIDDNSGVGTQFVVDDINKDGKPDIATSNKKGTFVFIQE
jgi:hypothetical protein